MPRYLLSCIFLLLFALCIPQASHAQQYKLCCTCKSIDNGAPFVTPTAAVSLGDTHPCVIACASNRGNWTRQAWLVETGAACGTNPPGPPAPRQPTPENLRADVAYSVGHQGAKIWVGTSDETLKGEQLRASLAGVPMNSEAIRSAPIALLEQAALEGATDCVNQRNIDPDFRWVFAKAGGEIRAAAQGGDYNHIRDVFSFYESHDDQLRARLYCRNGSEIRRLVSSSAAVPLGLDLYGQPLLEGANGSARGRGFAYASANGVLIWIACGLALGLLIGMIAVIIVAKFKRAHVA